MLDDEAHVAANVDDEEENIKPFDGMEDIINHLEELIGEAVHDLIQLYFHIFDFNNKTYFMIPPLSPYGNQKRPYETHCYQFFTSYIATYS